MQAIVKSLLLAGFLASCGTTTEESRYRDTEALERPPIVTSGPTKEQRIVDTSSIPKKKDRTGLGSDVYLSTPTQLTIKQPFDDAWNTLGRALKQSGIKITDHERDKGLYYVTRETADTSGFFAKASSFFSDDVAIYLLTIKPESEETTVTATLANASEQSSAAKDGTPQPSAEGPEDLLQLLFNMLRDKLEED
ncbi:MAG: outer membrane protein assembly factor BamC [Methylobacter sp.]|uniref:outer membrane protein assembly factor BamC n=1 Tax=Methylobacter sp. TaxID=2051955 RepID=UPI0027315AA9|nr:outer membrane protein assembly factor BamC [Methylobacter sp.]MDP1663710.1 outer membrane protein assembly factor BamC [Methylobacter sp.]MDP1970937.1 outer membrane protein assembly factor BamC [Methylobacter sp.]